MFAQAFLREKTRRVAKSMAEVVNTRLLDPGSELSAPPMPSTELPSADKIERYLATLDLKTKAGKVNPNLAKCVEFMQPVFVFVLRVVMWAAPLYMWLAKWAYKVYLVLPTNIVQMIFGAALCFFGGTYVASIAAIEAFRQMGWERVSTEMAVVAAQAKLVADASEKDDKVDADGDGVADGASVPAPPHRHAHTPTHRHRTPPLGPAPPAASAERS